MKPCPRCDRILTHDHFYRNAARSDGLAHYCKPCAREYKQRYKARASLAARRYDIKQRYGLSLEEYEALRDAQTGCDLCGDVPTRYVLDHCHATGRIRGLLCTQCNVGLGMFKDSAERLALAANYLERTHAPTHNPDGEPALPGAPAGDLLLAPRSRKDLPSGGLV